jgi:Ca2+-binding RTX toxin-like protein
VANISLVGTRINIGNASTLAERDASLVRLQDGTLGVIFTAEQNVSGDNPQNIFFQKVNTNGTTGSVQTIIAGAPGAFAVSHAEAVVMSNGTLGVVFQNQTVVNVTSAGYVNFNTTTGTQSNFQDFGEIVAGRLPDIAAMSGNGAAFSFYSPLGKGTASFQSTVGESFTVSSNRTNGSENSIARLDNGSFVISGHGSVTPTQGAAHVSLFNSTGTEILPDVSTTGSVDFFLGSFIDFYTTPDVHALYSKGLGHFLSSWSFESPDDGQLSYGFSVMDDRGEVIGIVEDFATPDMAIGDIIPGDIARMANGGFVITYMDENLDTYVHAYDAIGRSYGPSVKVNVLPGSQVYAPAIQTINGVVYIAFAEGQTGGMALQRLSLTENSAPIYGTINGDTLTGTSGNNIMFGDNGNDTLNAGGGNDRIFGGLGNDTISDGSGNDIVFGGEGDDRFIAGTGNDEFNGHNGRDTVDYRTSTVAANFSLNPFFSATDTGFSIEVVLGSGFDDTFNAEGELVQGPLDIYGGGGGDAISTGEGEQRLFGNTGNDDLTGGGDNDTLSGGSGADVFRYNFRLESNTINTDTITDFEANATDLIRLREMDAISGGADNNFAFLATKGAAFTALGQLRWLQVGGDTYVEGNTTGTLNADFRIKLTGLMNLDATDFVL